jgi:hypothetical protein
VRLRRTRLVGIVALVASLLGLSPGANVEAARGTGSAASTAAATGTAADPTAIAAAIERQAGDRYGGYWVEQRDGDDVVHVNVVDPTDADRSAAEAAEAADGAGDDVEVHDAAHSYDQLVAARDSVASSLDRERTGDFAVGVDVPDNAVTVETERGDADATRLLALAALREQAAVTPNSDPDPGGSISLDRLNVLAGSAIGIEPLSASPTEFPPYEAGLHLLISSTNAVIRCTSAFSFSNASGTYGTTAGHCAKQGEQVRVGDTAVGPVSINSFQSASRVEADVALYSLTARGWDHQALIHGSGAHRRVSGSLSDGQIGNGLRLCFDGRSSGIGTCGTVDTVGELICCDGSGRSFVFTCLDQPAQSGDSGGPVYQPVGRDRARAAGVLSSSVRVGIRRSMCFSTVDRIERATGTTVDTD